MNRQQVEQNSDLAKAEADLNKAREEWSTALLDAKVQRQVAGMPTSNLEEALKTAGQATDEQKGQADLAMGKVSAAGTFSASAAFGLGAGSTLTERMATAMEQTAKNTKTIADNTENGQTYGV